jgi:hypothetical protein
LEGILCTFRDIAPVVDFILIKLGKAAYVVWFIPEYAKTGEEVPHAKEALKGAIVKVWV